MSIRNQARYIPPEDIPLFDAAGRFGGNGDLGRAHQCARDLGVAAPVLPGQPARGGDQRRHRERIVGVWIRPHGLLDLESPEADRHAPDDPKPVFEIIPIQNISAEEAAQILDDLVEKRKPGTTTAVGASGGTLQGQQPELKIKVDPHSNSLLVVGLQDDVKNVLEIVARIDRAQPEPESDFHVYVYRTRRRKTCRRPSRTSSTNRSKPNKAPAERLRGTRPGGATTSGSSLSREQKPVIVANKDSNSLLVTANKTKWLEIRDIIERLDKRQAQVLIETAIIELSTNDALRLGVELGIVNLPPPGSDVSKGFGITNFGLSQLVDTNNDNFPDTRIVNSTLQGVTGASSRAPTSAFRFFSRRFGRSAIPTFFRSRRCW